jgi:hypothetical protein
MDCFRERYPDAGPGVILTPMDELSRRLVEAADVAARAPGWAYAPEVKGLAMRLELFNSLLRQFYIRYRRGLGLTAECRHGLLHCIWCESCFQDLLDDKVSPFRP